MALNVINGPFIQPGESLSDGVDCSGGDAVRITMPGAWSGGNLTFQISTDGALYNDLHEANGDEVTMVVVPGAAVRIDREWAKFWNFIKFRSGTRDHPVVQRERREFAITLSTAAAAPPAARSADAEGPGSAIGVSCPSAAGAPGIEGTISNKRR
jgi:hypothetical protein